LLKKKEGPCPVSPGDRRKKRTKEESMPIGEVWTFLFLVQTGRRQKGGSKVARFGGRRGDSCTPIPPRFLGMERGE